VQGDRITAPAQLCDGLRGLLAPFGADAIELRTSVITDAVTRRSRVDTLRHGTMS
jgi:hypothetical protein